MDVMTLPRPPQRVNTLCGMEDRVAAGARLRAFVHEHKGARSMDRLATDAGLRGRQTLNEWFAGGDFYVSSLAQLADALGVRRVDLVAAYDGVTAPEQTETAPPKWAERLLAGSFALEAKAGLTDEERDQAAALAAAWAASEELSERRRRGGDGAGGAATS